MISVQFTTFEVFAEWEKILEFEEAQWHPDQNDPME